LERARYRVVVSEKDGRQTQLAAAAGHPLGFDAAVWRRGAVYVQVDSDQDKSEINANSAKL
jgi:hypothetical protein